MNKGVLYGVGTGPGDPELLTIKAVRTIESCPVIAAPQAQIVLLVKPQFEVGKGNLGKNGIVESQELREQALSSVVACAERNGLDVRATTVSPIEGTHGNIEYLLYAVMQ